MQQLAGPRQQISCSCLELLLHAAWAYQQAQGALMLRESLNGWFTPGDGRQQPPCNGVGGAGPDSPSFPNLPATAQANGIDWNQAATRFPCHAHDHSHKKN